MRQARLHRPYRGYYCIEVDTDSYQGGYGGCQYRCIVIESGVEIMCYRDEFEWV
jgi:hypothetical protein